VRIVDAHHHLWNLSVRDQDWITGDELAPLRRDFLLDEYAALAQSAGVSASVVVQTVTVPEETPELLALAATSTLIAGVVGWTDLTSPDVAEQIKALAAQPGGEKLVGIRHQVQSEPDPHWLTRPEAIHGLEVIAGAGLVYDLVITPGQLTAAADAAEALPDLVFILDHLGKPPIATSVLEPWRRNLKRLAALPNTVCKLSGVVTQADWHRWKLADLRPYTETVLDAFGPDRLMFGSDWPVCTLAAEYADVLVAALDFTAMLSPDERTAVFAKTATRVYGL
jgi:predicted TIM-barrel fold metal-dependent hydrolase